ncbi:hypothetical protein [Intestinibacter bartlettii]
MKKNKKLINERPNFESPFWIWPQKNITGWKDMKKKLSDGIGYL